jgi:hypothetical protein
MMCKSQIRCPMNMQADNKNQDKRPKAQGAQPTRAQNNLTMRF